VLSDRWSKATIKVRLAERDADIRRCQHVAWIEPGEDATEASELA
jgi:hypothetical protein